MSRASGFRSPFFNTECTETFLCCFLRTVQEVKQSDVHTKIRPSHNSKRRLFLVIGSAMDTNKREGAVKKRRQRSVAKPKGTHILFLAGFKGLACDHGIQQLLQFD